MSSQRTLLRCGQPGGPPLRSKPSPASFSRFVDREMHKPEVLLKILMSEPENLLEAFVSQLAEGTSAELQGVLQMKGVLRERQHRLLYEFSLLKAKVSS